MVLALITKNKCRIGKSLVPEYVTMLHVSCHVTHTFASIKDPPIALLFPHFPPATYLSNTSILRFPPLLEFSVSFYCQQMFSRFAAFLLVTAVSVPAAIAICDGRGFGIGADQHPEGTTVHEGK